ncbi:MAG: hypothetical protein GY925_17580 [Actinomycetia bacterium]|nr:hypothetical protein [Actinomycetes bacterium]
MTRLARRITTAMILGIVLVPVVSWADSAAAHDCSSPADCEETGGYNGIIAVVGGGAAVAAAAAAAVAATPAGEETDLAIVQVSSNLIEVEPDKPAEFTLTGWHVGAEGKTTQVAMPFNITVPPDSGLLVVPLTGTGTLVVTVSVEELGEITEFDLIVQGSWKNGTASETVHVIVGGEYGLRLF